MGNINTVLTPRVDLQTITLLLSKCNNNEVTIIHNIIPSHLSFDLDMQNNLENENSAYFKSNVLNINEILNKINGNDTLSDKYVVLLVDDLNKINEIYIKYSQ